MEYFRLCDHSVCEEIAGYLELDALDVFGGHLPFWRAIVALAMHLIPAAIMTLLLVVSWRWEWVGGAVTVPAKE